MYRVFITDSTVAIPSTVEPREHLKLQIFVGADFSYDIGFKCVEQSFEDWANNRNERGDFTRNLVALSFGSDY